MISSKLKTAVLALVLASATLTGALEKSARADDPTKAHFLQYMQAAKLPGDPNDGWYWNDWLLSFNVSQYPYVLVDKLGWFWVDPSEVATYVVGQSPMLNAYSFGLILSKSGAKGGYINVKRGSFIVNSLQQKLMYVYLQNLGFVNLNPAPTPTTTVGGTAVNYCLDSCTAKGGLSP